MIHRPRTLAFWLALVFGFFAIALVAAFGVFAEHEASQRLLDAQKRQLAQAATQMSKRLDQDMLAHFREITVAATSMVLGDPERFDDKKIYLERIRSRLPDYAWIGLTDERGKIIAATDNLLVGVDVSHRDWFEAGRAKPSVLDVHQALLLQSLLAPNSPTPLRFVDLTAPVYDRARGFRGVLAGHLSWAWADQARQSILASVGSLDDLELMVISRSGEVILGSPHRIGQSIEVRHAPQGAPFAPRIRETDETIAAFADTRGLAEYPGLGWTVVAQMPVSAALAPVREMRGRIIAGGLLVCAFFVWLGVAMASFVARPVRRLARAAEKQSQDPAIELPLMGAYREVFTLSGALRRSTSALRAQQEELRALNDRLENEVATRTAELDEARLAAVSASEAKADFLATMSHEIRTPLASIVGFADLLLEDSRLDAEQRRRLRLIQSSGALLTGIINDILDFSKIEAGEAEIVDAPFDLRQTIEGCVALISPSADAKALTTRVHFADEIPHGRLGDANRIRQILLNLLSNAVKFTRNGAVSVTVSEAGRGERPTISIAVSDTGVGIAPEKIGRLFRRFSQVDSSIEREFGGTGLGLAISQRLAGMMGGSISVVSTPGQGSTFTLTLPLTEAALRDSAETAADEGVAPLRILLVEDVAPNREIARAILESAGHQVTEAADGSEAIGAASLQVFDVILMDVQMPGMSGLEATRAIRAGTGPNAASRIIGLTANVLDEHVEACRMAGMDGHIGKPIQRNALLAELTRDLGEAIAKAAGLSTSFQREMMDDMRSLLGPERLAGFVRDLQERLATFAASAPQMTPARLGETAHGLASLAGTLGFVGLAKRCRDLDAAVDRGGDVAASVTLVLGEISCAMQWLDQGSAGPARRADLRLVGRRNMLRHERRKAVGRRNGTG